MTLADIAAAGAETVAAIRSVGGEATYVCGDVAEPADVAAMIELIGAVQPGQRDADHAPARAGRPARPG